MCLCDVCEHSEIITVAILTRLNLELLQSFSLAGRWPQKQESAMAMWAMLATVATLRAVASPVACGNFESSLLNISLSAPEIHGNGCYFQMAGCPCETLQPQPLPESVDWRECWANFSVPQQWYYGSDHTTICHTMSCWAIAGATAIDGLRCKQMSPPGAGQPGVPPTPLKSITSVQEICSCLGKAMKGVSLCLNNGGNGGNGDVFHWATDKLPGGWLSEHDDPTVFSSHLDDQQCDWPNPDRKKGLLALGGCSYLNTGKISTTAEVMLASVVLQQPVSTAGTFGGKWFWSFKGNPNGIIVDGAYLTNDKGTLCGCMKGGDHMGLTHYVTVVGFGVWKEEDLQNGMKYWIIRNSYGESWGNKGYLWLERDSPMAATDPYHAFGLCCIARAPSFPAELTTTTTTSTMVANCAFGDDVKCDLTCPGPPGECQMCRGEQCCSDGALCPSAWYSVGCSKPKHYSCSRDQVEAGQASQGPEIIP